MDLKHRHARERKYLLSKILTLRGLCTTENASDLRNDVGGHVSVEADVAGEQCDFHTIPGMFPGPDFAQRLTGSIILS